MEVFKKYLPIFTFILFPIFSYAQNWGQNWGCYDSTLIVVGAYCHPVYEPVCACDGKTYRNYCFSRYAGYQIYYDGICEVVDFDIKANLIVHENLKLDIITREAGPVYLTITDWYGKVHHQDFFPMLRRQLVEVPVFSYGQGLYVVVVRYGDSGKVVKKFVKVSQ
jgi:hypothetical protein